MDEFAQFGRVRSRPLCRKFLTGLAAIGIGWPSSGAQVAEPDAPMPARRIYIGLDDHTDYMWSADEAYYHQAFLSK